MTNETNVTELLQAASDAHHVTHEKTNGADVDWSLWYAHWLIDNLQTKALLGSSVTESKLAYALLALDIDYTNEKSDVNWAEYYAQNIERYLTKRVSNN